MISSFDLQECQVQYCQDSAHRTCELIGLVFRWSDSPTPLLKEPVDDNLQVLALRNGLRHLFDDGHALPKAFRLSLHSLSVQSLLVVQSCMA